MVWSVNRLDVGRENKDLLRIAALLLGYVPPAHSLVMHRSARNSQLSFGQSNRSTLWRTSLALAVLCLMLPTSIGAQEGGSDGTEATTVATAGAGERAPERYEFFVNRRPMDASLYKLGDPDDPVGPGDVADFTNFLLYLDEAPGKIELLRPRGRDKVFHVDAEGERRLIWYRTKGRLGPVKIDLLWGLRIERWNKQLESALNSADVSKLCVSIDGSAAVRGYGLGLPPLPENLRCLSLTNFRDISGIERLTQLRYLSVGLQSSEFDASLLEKNQELRALRLAFGGEFTKGIPSFPHLHRVSIFGRFRNLESLLGLQGIRTMEIRADVTDLTPITHFNHLEVLRTSAEVRSLPAEPHATLRELRILNEKLAPGEFEHFEGANPKCEVLRTIDEAFRYEVRGTDRIRVRGGCQHWHHYTPAVKRTIYEVTNAEEIGEVISNIHVPEPALGGNWNGCATHTIEFLRGDEVLFALSVNGIPFYVQSRLWAEDWMLTAPSMRFLDGWLRRHGVRLDVY